MLNHILTPEFYYALTTVGHVALIMFPLILCVAYLTYVERKVIAAMQLRVGPSVVGPLGVLQPIADALKLMHKEIIIPQQADRFLFLLAPIITFTFAMVAWAVIPFGPTMVLADINAGVLYLFAVSSLGVYGIIIAGWASNSKYALLGSLRSVAQMISYEVSMGFILATVCVCVGSLRLIDIIQAQEKMWFIVPLFPLFVIFFISTLAETNRAPFDLPVAEAEIVGGYHVEYSSMPFALFFLGEYANMILMSAFTTIMFLGGWQVPFNLAMLKIIPGFVWFALKISFILFLFLWVRATLPRYRYDQLMNLSWKVFLPISIFYLIAVSGVLFYFDMLPA